MADKLSRDEWEAQVFRSVARSAPDEFGDEFARAVVADYLENGAYEDYLAGEFDGDLLYQPIKRSLR